MGSCLTAEIQLTDAGDTWKGEVRLWDPATLS